MIVKRCSEIMWNSCEGAVNDGRCSLGGWSVTVWESSDVRVTSGGEWPEVHGLDSWQHRTMVVNQWVTSLFGKRTPVPVACPQSGILHESWVWGGRGRRNNSLQYLEFGLQYPFQPAICNITYCTFMANFQLFLQMASYSPQALFSIMWNS